MLYASVQTLFMQGPDASLYDELGDAPEVEIDLDGEGYASGTSSGQHQEHGQRGSHGHMSVSYPFPIG